MHPLINKIFTDVLTVKMRRLINRLTILFLLIAINKKKITPLCHLYGIFYGITFVKINFIIGCLKIEQLTKISKRQAGFGL